MYLVFYAYIYVDIYHSTDFVHSSLYTKGGNMADMHAPVWNFWGSVFVNFDFNSSQHAMFTICILFSTLTTKNTVCVKAKGHQNKSPDPKNYTAPPGSEIPGSATVYISFTNT